MPASQNGLPATAATDNLLRYDRALAAAGIGVWEVDLTTGTVVWDDICRTLFGLAPDSDAGLYEAIAFIHPEDQPRIQASLQAAMSVEGGGRFDEQYRVPGAVDSVLRHIRTTGEVAFGADGTPLRFSGIAQDLTDWTATRERADALERTAQTALESTGAGWFRVGMPDGDFEHSPELARVMTGDASKKFSRETLTEYIHPEDREIRQKAYEEAGKTDVLDYTVRFVWDDESLHWVRVSGRYHRDAGGTVSLFTGTAQDVTVQRRAARDLLLKDRAIAAADDGIIITGAVNPESPIVYVNPAFEAMTGYKSDEIIGQDCRFLQNGDTDQPALVPLRAAIRAGKACTVVLRNYRKDGVLFYNELSISPVYEDGELVNFIGIQKDVTDAQQAEDALRRSEELNQGVLNSLDSHIAVLDADGVIVAVNNAWRRFATDNAAPGTTPPESLGTNYLTACDMPDMPVDADAFAANDGIRAVIEGQLPSFEMEYPCHAPHSERWFSLSVTPLALGKGAVVAHTNITKRKQAEQAALHSKEELEFAIDAAELGTWDLNPATSRFSANARLKDWFGLQPNDEIPLTLATDVIAEEDRERIRGAIAAAIQPNAASYDEEYTIIHPKTGARRIVRAKGKPAYAEDGTVVRFNGTMQDITQEAEARKSIERSEAQFRSVIQAAPAAMGLFVGRDLIIETPNQTFIDIVGKGWDVVGKPLREAMPELVTEGQPFLKILDDVFTTGVPFVSPGSQVKILRDGVMTDNFYNITYTPLFDNEGKVFAILDIAVDVTEQIRAQQALAGSEAQFRSLIEEAPVATCLFVGRELRIEIANSAMIAVMGKGPDVVGKSLLEAIPELAGQPFPQILTSLFDTGETFEAKSQPATLVMDGEEQHFFFDYTFKPLRNATGEVWAIIDMSVDVTVAVKARRELEESEARLRNLIESAPFPIGVYVGEELRIQFANESIIQIFGKGPDVVGKTYTEVLPELESSGIFDQLRGVIRTGEAFHAKGQRVDIVVDGKLTEFYFNYSFTPVYDVDGQVYAVMNTAADVTAMVKARQQVEDAEAQLRGAVELAELATWSLDVKTGAYSGSQRFLDWLGVDTGATETPEGTLSIPESHRDVVLAAVSTALGADNDGIYEAEHPVVSQQTGQTRIIHAQGLASYDDNGKPTMLSGTAQDVTKERALQAELERQVQERTVELADANKSLTRSNEELSQYAYVASHDLQEPLRKIRMFSGILQKQAGLPQDAPPVISRIAQAAERMSELIQSLLEFSRLLNSEALQRPVDLNETLADIVKDFELVVSEKDAKISVSQLPVVDAVGLQMNQLFYNLIGNALKFSKRGEAPDISVEAEPVDAQMLAEYLPAASGSEQYCHITVSDNGIGFETRYADQIFEVFKRLHTREVYPGSGIGLALCRRIVERHGGALWADSTPGVGTTFNILLPTYKADEVE